MEKIRQHNDAIFLHVCILLQAGAAVPGPDALGYVDLEQPLRQVLLRSEVPGGKKGLSSTIQPSHEGRIFEMLDHDKCLRHLYLTVLYVV